MLLMEFAQKEHLEYLRRNAFCCFDCREQEGVGDAKDVHLKLGLRHSVGVAEVCLAAKCICLS